MPCLMREIASDVAVTRSSGSGCAKMIISSGKSSGMPPTFVETTKSPHDAASRIVMQNASIRDVLRKIEP